MFSEAMLKVKTDFTLVLLYFKQTTSISVSCSKIIVDECMTKGLIIIQDNIF